MQCLYLIGDANCGFALLHSLRCRLLLLTKCMVPFGKFHHVDETVNSGVVGRVSFVAEHFELCFAADGHLIHQGEELFGGAECVSPLCGRMDGRQQD